MSIFLPLVSLPYWLVGVVVAAFLAIAGQASRAAASPADRVSVADLVARLGSDDRATRDESQRRLEGRVDAIPALTVAAAKGEPEVKRRAARLLDRLGHLARSQQLDRARRLMRAGDIDQAVEVLVRYGQRETDTGFLDVLKEELGRLLDGVSVVERKWSIFEEPKAWKGIPSFSLPR